jgi:hypothetical protein
MVESKLGNRPVKAMGYKYPELQFPELRFGTKPATPKAEEEAEE